MASDPFYSAFVEIIPTAKGFEQSLTKQINGSSAVAGGVAGGVAGKGFVGGFAKFLPAIGTALAGAGIGNLIGNAIDSGATYEQAKGAVDQVFGRLGADAINAFAGTAASTVGQSMNDVLGSASLIGTFGKAAGLADRELADFSTSLITLGADLGAFANTDPQQAVEALSAGLRGESEPLRKYGVLLDDATLKARAMEMGIYDGTGSLTQQQRILAAYNEILAQTTDQQGQYARESESLPALQAQMAARFDDIATKVGTAFLPIAEDLTELFVEKMIPTFEDFAEWLNKPATQDGIEKFGEGLGAVVGFALDVSVAFDGLRKVGAELFSFLNGGVSLEQLWAGLTSIPGPVGDIAQGFYDMVESIYNSVQIAINELQNFGRQVDETVRGAIGWFQSLPTKIGEAVAGIGSWLKDSGRALIQGFIDGIDSMFTPIRNAVTGVLDYVAGFFPNSPAKHGPLSGSGWTKLGQSGIAIAQQFARGIASDYSAVRGAAQGMAAAAVAGPTIAPKMSIYAAPGMDEGALMRKAARYVEGLVD